MANSKNKIWVFLFSFLIITFALSFLGSTVSAGEGPEEAFNPTIGRQEIKIKFLSRTTIEVTFPDKPIFESQPNGPTYDSLLSGKFYDKEIDDTFEYLPTNENVLNSCSGNPKVLLSQNGRAKTNLTNTTGENGWEDLPFWSESGLGSVQLFEFCIPASASPSITKSYTLGRRLKFDSTLTWGSKGEVRAQIHVENDGSTVDFTGFNISMRYEKVGDEHYLYSLEDSPKKFLFTSDPSNPGNSGFRRGQNIILVPGGNVVNFVDVANDKADITPPAGGATQISFFGAKADFGTVGELGGGTGILSNSPTCATTNGTMGWLVCSAVESLVGAVTFFSKIIEYFLKVQPITRTTTIDGEATVTGIYMGWAAIRNISLVAVAIAMLVMVFGQTLGIEAYTVKKMLPRLAVAVIAIWLSFYLVAILVDIFNVLGAGIDNLLKNAMGTIQVSWTEFVTGTVLTLFAAAGGAAIWAFGVGGTAVTPALGTVALFILMPLILGVLATFFTLILRQVVITMLVLLSPLAFLAWTLPNTEKYFTIWKDTLIKALIMYPLIMALLVSGQVFASILTTGETSFVNYLIALLAIALPLFMVPMTFKMAGGVIAGGMNAMNKLSKGTGGYAKDKLAPGLAHKRALSKNKFGNRFMDADKEYKNTRTGRMRKRARQSALGKGAAGALARFGPNYQEQESQLNAIEGKRVQDATASGPDGWVYAMLGMERDPRTGEELAPEAINYAKKHRGNKHMLQGALTYAMSKADSTEQLAHVQEAFEDTARREGLTKREVAGVVTGSRYALQGIHGAEKHKKAVRDMSEEESLRDEGFRGPEHDEHVRGMAGFTTSGADSFVQELLESKDPYSLSKERASYFESLGHAEDMVEHNLARLGGADGGNLTEAQEAYAVANLGVRRNADNSIDQQSLDNARQKHVRTLGKFGSARDRIRQSIELNSQDPSRGEAPVTPPPGDEDGDEPGTSPYVRSGGSDNTEKAMVDYMNKPSNS